MSGLDWRLFVSLGMQREPARKTSAGFPVAGEIEALEPRLLLTGHHDEDSLVLLDEYGDETWAEGDLPIDANGDSGDGGGAGPQWNPPQGTISGNDDISGVNDGTYDLADTFNLHSYAGSNFTIYLDFDGHTTSGTYWNTYYNSGNDIVTEAWSYDGDRSTFSTTEQQMIQRIWASVAEDFAPFDVNVTTADPGADALRKSNNADTQYGVRVVIGPNSFYSSAGGVAFIGSFDWSTDTPAFVFNSSEVGVREAISHEVGHALNLYHDGTSSSSYYSGHGSGATSWSPIMGVGYYTSVSQWSQGEYTDADNTEDDLQIITTQNGFGYRADDVGNTFAAASGLSLDGASLSGQGLIERNTDIDVFSFITGTGTVSLDIDAALYSANLDIFAAVYDASGSLIATSNPADSLSASFSLDLSAGTYYVTVDGTGTGDPTTGFSDYGSLGNYWISGTVAENQSPVANDDTATTNEDTAVTINVMANDSDADGQSLTIISLNNGSYGTVLYSNGQVVYTPGSNYFGTDSFTYSVSDGYGGVDTATVTVTIVSTPESVTITGPSSSTTDNTPTITWNALGDATRYEVLIYDGNTGQMVASDANATGTSYTASSALSSSSYQVYVRGVNASDVAGDWGMLNFTVTPPGATTITGPSGATSDTTPTITWNAVTDADHYEVLVYSSTRGALVLDNANVSATSLTAGSSLQADSYQAYVRAVNSTGDSGTWGSLGFSITAAATPESVVITGPTGSTTDTTPTITWNAAGNADHYEVLIYSATLGQMVDGNNNVAGTSYTPASAIPDDTYQVFVRAVAANSTAGAWSSTQFTVNSSVTPGEVFITGPSGSVSDATPTITWNAATNADHYEVLIYSTTLGQMAASDANVGGTSFTPGSELADDSYVAYVRAVSSDGTPGNWGMQEFSVSTSTAPGDVTVTGPSQSTPDATPTVTWDAAANADHYEIQVYSTTQGQLVESANNVTATSYTLSTQLPADSYRVYIRAVDGNGTPGNWSTYDFNVVAAAALSEIEFLDMFWELASNSESVEDESALWSD